ncbi:hypothetical protein JCM8208_006263 [Rhodotorula glutinis]
MARITRSAAKADAIVAAEVAAAHTKAMDEYVRKPSAQSRKKVAPAEVHPRRLDNAVALEDDEVMRNSSDMEREEVDIRTGLAPGKNGQTPKSTPRKKAPSAPKKVARAPRLALARNTLDLEVVAPVAAQQPAAKAQRDPKRPVRAARAVVVEVDSDEDVVMELLCGPMSTISISVHQPDLVYRDGGDDMDVSDDDKAAIDNVSDDDL